MKRKQSGTESLENTFVLSKQSPQDRTGNYVRLVNYNSAESKEKKYFSGEHRYFGVNQADFAKIPGSAIAYWASNRVLEIFGQAENIKKYAQPCVGLFTCNNQRFLRFLVSVSKDICLF